MSNRIFIGLLFILLVFFLSIDQPLIHFTEAASKYWVNTIPEDFECLQSALPDGVTALYFSEPNGSLSWVEKFEAEYFLLQYHLAPRLLAGYRDRQGDFSRFDWFIAQRFELMQLETLADSYRLKIVRECGDYSVLQRHD